MDSDVGQTKADLLLHPVRIRIMSEFAGRQRTTQQLAEALPGIPQATLYRQISALVDGGLLEVAEEKRVNGALERTYQVADDGGRLIEDDLRGMSVEDHLRAFTIYTAALIDSFSDYIQSCDLARVREDGLAYNRAVVYLSDEERAQFDAEFQALTEQMLGQAPAPGRKRYTVASLVIPDGKRG